LTEYCPWPGCRCGAEVFEDGEEEQMLDKAPNKKLSDLLDTFGSALASGDIDTAVGCFQEDCYWRDLVTFTWNIVTLEGRDAVRAMLPGSWAMAEAGRIQRQA